MGNTTYIYNNTLADGKINESTAANKLINKREASKMNDCLIFDTYIEKIQMPLCSYILFIVSSVFTIALLIILWICVYKCSNQDIFVITSIFVGIMTVVIVTFSIVNLVFSEASRKYALLTYAYDKAIAELENRCDKKTTTSTGKTPTETEKTEIEYGIRTITKIFETYCQKITAK
ncbi:MAG: hypothetical protein P1P65_01575 [Treponema sp.]